jgi:hypothetical protein
LESIYNFFAIPIALQLYCNRFVIALKSLCNCSNPFVLALQSLLNSLFVLQSLEIVCEIALESIRDRLVANAFQSAISPEPLQNRFKIAMESPRIPFAISSQSVLHHAQSLWNRCTVHLQLIHYRCEIAKSIDLQSVRNRCIVAMESLWNPNRFPSQSLLNRCGIIAQSL